MVVAKRSSELGWFDYLLSGTASCLAGYSAGYGLGVAEIAWFFVGLVAAATFGGALLQWVIPKKIAGADGFLYAGSAILAVYFGTELNNLLPSEGFPPQLRVAGWLCWMLVFGSLFMWRDSTVLFQAVPGIAIFGLVGTWDTFRAAPFLFFVFLLCFATLFARAHARGMMMRARGSGFSSNVPDSTSQDGFLRALRKGPWRWMAGPEWALLSAFMVVLISLIGAPFLQFSLKGVSGRLRLPPPPTSAMQKNYFGNVLLPQGTNFNAGVGTEVGQGPRGALDKVKVFAVNFPGEPYMMAHAARVYQHRSWAFVQSYNGFTGRAQAEFNLNTDASGPGRIIPFTVHYLTGNYDSVPIPGAIVQILPPLDSSAFRPDGSVTNVVGAFGSNSYISGSVRVPIGNPTTVPKNNPTLSAYTDTSNQISTPRVRALARKLVQGPRTDYDKAEAIRSYIASHCTYDLNAAPIPGQQDAVDYFLFDSKRGYCDLFASAMTVMCQAADLPSRFVTGWAPFTDPTPDINGNVTYYDTDYHCWSEVYFKNVGWVIFDATDGAAEAKDGGRGSTKYEMPWYLQWSVVFGLIAFGLIGAAAWGRTMTRRMKLRFPGIGQKRAELERAYSELVRTLEKRTGKPRRPNQTAFEYLYSVEPYLDGTFAIVQAVTEKFVSTYYGSADPSAEDILEVKELSKSAREALKSIKPFKNLPDSDLA